MSELALKLIEQNRRQYEAGDTACKRLDIGRCGLTEIPEEVFELVWLEELILSTSWSDFEIDWIKKLPNSASSQNNENTNHLSSIPKGLLKLTNLTVLRIGGTPLLDKWAIKKIENLPESIVNLDLNNNQIDKIENLPASLLQLNIGDNNISKIENLPKDLKKLILLKNQITKIEHLPSKLDFLYIGDNKIPRLENLPAGIIHLYIGGNQITKLENLPKRLKYFIIAVNQISKLENLPGALTILNIHSNQITKIENLPKKLSELDISINKISKLENLPPTLAELFISNNQISRLENLPGGLTQLAIASNKINRLENIPNGLTHLWIYSNQISRLENLPETLTQLDISRNQITLLENLPQSLSRIYIKNNKIKDISTLKDWVLNKDYKLVWDKWPLNKELAIGGNPLTTPPAEIVQRGYEAVFEYFKQLEKERAKLYESKLLIVGQGEVGKTWLLQRLITGKTPEDGKTTEGIDIRTWNFDYQEIKDFRVNFWDFGGQEIYHATHQFFLTKRSLYLFVWDARKEQDIITSFDYWLNVISLLSRQSPVIVVMNKCDERTKAIEEETLKKRFGNIIAFHKVSALDGTGIEALKADLIKHIAALPQVGTDLPKVWNDIRLELEGLGKNSISLKEYNEICGRHGLNPTEAAFIGDYYHDLGVFLHFRDNAILRDIVFLNPEWATTAVYKIIDTKDVQKAYGHFEYGKLKEIWQEYDEDKYKYLLELMKRFELCYQIGNSEKYIVPELLRPEYPELEWDYADNLRFELRYDFMPAGIITRLITRRNHQIKDEICWRNGLIIERNNSEALIISDPISRKISIWIRGDERKEMLYLIRDEIDQIHETLNFPSFKAMYPCICSECKTSEAPYFFDSAVLVKFMLKRKPTAECQKSAEDVNIEELRGSIMSNTDFAYDAILSIIRTNQEMLHQVIEMLTAIKSNQPDKDTVLDEFFKIVPMNLGVINAGELLKKLLRFRKERLDFGKD